MFRHAATKTACAGKVPDVCLDLTIRVFQLDDLGRAHTRDAGQVLHAPDSVNPYAGHFL